MLFPCLFRQVPSPRTLRGTFPRDYKRNQGKGELNQVEIVIFLIFRTVTRGKGASSYLPPPYAGPKREFRPKTKNNCPNAAVLHLN